MTMRMIPAGPGPEGQDAPFLPYGRGSAPGEQTPLQIAMRYKWRILAFAFAATLLAFLVVKSLPVRYASTASVMVDARQLRVSGESLLSNQTLDLDLLRTRMETLRAPVIVRRVVEELRLNEMPEICAALAESPPLGERLQAAVSGVPRWLQRAQSLFQPGIGWPERLAILTGSDGPGRGAAPCPVPVQEAARYLPNIVSASNDSRSYIIRLSGEAGDPVLAARIANAYAAAFVDQQRQEKDNLAELANAWMTAHVGQLRAQMQQNDAAVERYRSQNNLTQLRGETMVAQSLAELNSQLSVATSELAQKRSLLGQVEAVSRNGGQLDASVIALSSPLIQRLVEQETQLAGQLAEIRSGLGDAHPRVSAMNAQLGRVRQQIRSEVGKTLTGLRGEVAALEARRASLERNVQQLHDRVAQQGPADVRLRELEREAASTRNRYEQMMTRLEQVRAEQALQRADAHVVVEALPPEFPSFPRTRMIVAGVFMASLGVGTAAAFALTLFSQVFKDADELEEHTGLRVLGLFPTPVRRSRPQDVVLERPGTPEAEAMHSILANLLDGRLRVGGPLGRIIMVASALPNEGKSSFSVALGRSAAQAGLSAAVVDCDLRRATVRTLFAGLERANEPQLLAAPEQEAEPVFADERIDRHSSLRVLPVAAPVANPHAALAAASLPRLLARLRAEHDLVILDTPPVLAVSDALILAPLADKVVMVVGWRSTSRAAVQSALKALHRVGAELAGAVLSKVDLRRYARKTASDAHYAYRYRGYADGAARAG